MLILSSGYFLLVLSFIYSNNAAVLLGADGDDVVQDDDPKNDEYFHTLAERAVNKINADGNDIKHWKLDKLISGKKQVIAGVKYNLKFSMVRTECEKQKDAELAEMELCSVRDDAPKEVCEFDVIVKQWEDSEKYVNNGCIRQEMYPKKNAEHKLRNNQENLVTKTAENVLKISENIKPKDFSSWNLFNGFIDRFAKAYSSKKEILRRFKIYKRNLRIAKIWQDNDQGTAVYGETPFMDMTPAEFRKIYLPYRWQKPAQPVRRLNATELSQLGDELSATSVDWRTKGVVTPVKNQGACGSCWAFSVTGNIEGQWAKKSGKLVSLSEQELVDCDIVDQGCNGGLPLNAYKEIIRIGGLEPEAEYPYDARKETCHLARKDIAVYINDSVQLPQDEAKMAIWLFKNGPISIGVNASPLQFYRHGISHPWKVFCSPLFLNHGVLIVGYGQEGNKPFWIIKNSWGESWGENGYYRLYRGKNVCGVNEMATSSIIH
uniref:Cysteine proteinase n=2 Tax=Acrobeloides nanus TaxID=290746 RepID=A0A914DFY1_9BILA